MLLYDNALWLLLAALVLDGRFGDPDWLWRRFPHPVVLFGKVISALDRHLNRPSDSAGRRMAFGVLALAILVAGSLALGTVIQDVAGKHPVAELVTVLVAAVFLAQKSLASHVAAVRSGLTAGGLTGGRKAVAMIVGRDPEQLDEAGVSRAAIESCAENFSDGVVAPAMWFALLGLPGLIAYKAVNTADSMIGHKTGKYQHFGWAAARFDDLVNLPASRLSGLCLAIASPLVRGSIRDTIGTMGRDARKHRSPNAGWPEAAMAGALGIALAGPRAYPGYTVDDPFMNRGGRKKATADDISRALRVLWGGWASMVILVGILAASHMLLPNF